jgi:hydrogenase large subunit
MTDWGRKPCSSRPGVVVDGKLVTNDLVDINLGIRILLGSSYYDDWEGEETFVKKDPLGNPVDRRHPVEPAHQPKPQKRDFDGASTVGHVAALVRRAPITWRSTPAAARWPGCGRRRSPAWSTSATSRPPAHSVKINLPKTALKPEVEFEWKIPKWSNTHRARPRPHLLPGLRRAARCTSSRRR